MMFRTAWWPASSATRRIKASGKHFAAAASKASAHDASQPAESYMMFLAIIDVDPASDPRVGDLTFREFVFIELLPFQGWDCDGQVCLAVLNIEGSKEGQQSCSNLQCCLTVRGLSL